MNAEMLLDLETAEKATATTPLGFVIGRLLQRHNLSINQVSKGTGLSNTTLKRLCTDPDCNPTWSSITTLSEFFGVTPPQLMGLEPFPNMAMGPFANRSYWVSVPVLSLTQVMQWPTLRNQLEKDEHTSFVKTDLNVSQHVFSIRATDESLEPKFSAGTALIFDPDRTPRNKDFVLFLGQGKSLPQIRQVFADGPDLYVRAVNPEFPQAAVASFDPAVDRMIATLIQSKTDYCL